MEIDPAVKVSSKYRDMSDPELKEFVKTMLSEDNGWALRALMTLYSYQTLDERLFPNQQHVSNGRGFAPQDQIFLSSIARAVTRGAELTPKQKYWIKQLLPKYAGQIVKAIRQNQKREDEAKHLSVPEYVFSQFLVNNSTLRMISNTGELGMDPNNVPKSLNIKSNSQEFGYLFLLKSAEPAPEEDSEEIVAYIFTGMIDNKEWEVVVMVDDGQEFFVEDIEGLQSHRVTILR